jgi:hypothetical protein
METDRKTTRRRRGQALAVGLGLATLVAAVLIGGSAEANSGIDSNALGVEDQPPEVAKSDIAEAAALGPSRPTTRIRFHFKKNHQDPTNSRLILQRVTLRGDLPPQYLKLGEWRAGSGLGAQHPRGRDECASAQGWLPNGRYDGGETKPAAPAHDTNFNGGPGGIFGIVWGLQNKTCHGPSNIKRTELFIHSEMTPDRKQRCAAGNYQEDQCWDGAKRPNDYVSVGCIKLSYKDIQEAAKLARAWGGPKPDQKHYRDLLIVTG